MTDYCTDEKGVEIGNKDKVREYNNQYYHNKPNIKNWRLKNKSDDKPEEGMWLCPTCHRIAEAVEHDPKLVLMKEYKLKRGIE
jgi:heterodisulfide reductase subunit C